MYKTIGVLIVSIIAFGFGVIFGAELPSPNEIVAKADEVRNPQLDYTVFVVVTSIKPDNEKKVAKYEVMVKGKEKSIVKTLSPDIERGRTLLMRGKDLWAFFPDVSQPIRISLQQRLIGEVANGDIARANFFGDYNAKILKDNKDHYVLELSAKSGDVTYNKVVYWVRKDNFHPVKAEFFAVSGRLLKICSYESYKHFAGRLRPTKLILEDPLLKGQMSIIEYENVKISELPEKYFTKDYLKKIKY